MEAFWSFALNVFFCSFRRVLPNVYGSLPGRAFAFLKLANPFDHSKKRAPNVVPVNKRFGLETSPLEECGLRILSYCAKAAAPGGIARTRRNDRD
jgi:hypothetical protein